MQTVKTFYERKEGDMDRKIEKYLQENPDLKIEMISSGSIVVGEFKASVFTTVVFSNAI